MVNGYMMPVYIYRPKRSVSYRSIQFARADVNGQNDHNKKE